MSDSLDTEYHGHKTMADGSRLSADGKVEPVPSYEDGIKEGLRRAADLCEHYAGIWEGEPVEHAKELHDLILSLLTKET